MGNLNKMVMLLSFIFVTICFGASIWMALVLKDITSYLIVVLFFLAIVWFGINLYKSIKKK